MSNSASVERFVREVNRGKGDKLQWGRVSGKCVTVAGRSYPAEDCAQTDTYDGKWLRVMVMNGTAVVIGE